MKKRLIHLLIPASIIATGCSSSEEKTHSGPSPRPDSVPTDTAATPDTFQVHNIPFEIQKFEKEKGENQLDVEYPISGNPELLDSVRTWMNQQLTDTYRGPLDDPQAFFNHYAGQLGQDPDLNEWGGYTKDDFKLGYLNDYIVTYLYTSYIYEGGAHGNGGTYGMTFLQKDGSIFNKECITNYRELHDFFVEGLKQYFKVQTDEQLLECLNEGTTIAGINPPGMHPWVESGGVVFSYTPYEVAPYSAGTPRFTIPYSKIEPYLTGQGKRFFGK